MPNPPKGGGAPTIVHNGKIVIVGANGTGKTRLGARLEADNRKQHLPNIFIVRISAQRVLTMPAEVPRQTMAAATRDLHTPGREYRRNTDSVALLNDYDAVMVALFAAYIRANITYVEAAKKAQVALTKPHPDVLDELETIWKDVFPHRQLLISRDDQTISTKAANSAPYSGQQMSDGERVALYLMAHVLLADNHSTILVDEPELHVHRSIQGLLWNALERARPTCTFIYITHDLDFAASRQGAVTVLLTEFHTSPDRWVWEQVPHHQDLPESLVLELLGSRRPTLFCEGDLGGLDQRTYEILFPNHYVRPIAGCGTVIQVVDGFRKNPGSHHLEPSGVIDPDDREARYLTALAGRKIFALGCAQIENVLVQEPVLRAVATKMGMDATTTTAVVSTVTTNLLAELKVLRDKLIFNRANALIKSRLTRFAWTTKDLNGLQQGMTQTTTASDPIVAFAEATIVIDGAIANGSLVKILEVFRNKGVKDKVATAFGKSIDEYIDLAFEVLRDPAVSAALRHCVPTIP